MMKPTLETVANLIIIVTGVFGIVVLASRATSDRQVPDRPQPARYQIGEQVEEALPVDFSKAQRTVVLVLNSGCVYCTRSLPFYRDLVAKRSTDIANTRLVAVGVETKDQLSNYLEVNGIKVDEVLSVGNGSIRQTGTPAILLVDRSRTVKGYWGGLLAPDREREVFAVLQSRQAS
jgi:hypothetical protein